MFGRLICFVCGVLLILYGVCYVKQDSDSLPSKDVFFNYLDETYTTVEEAIVNLLPNA
jgi:hypothetical protein